MSPMAQSKSHFARYRQVIAVLLTTIGTGIAVAGFFVNAPSLWRTWLGRADAGAKVYLQVTDSASHPIPGAVAKLDSGVQTRGAALSGVIDITTVANGVLKGNVSAPGYDEVKVNLAVPHESRLVNIVLTKTQPVHTSEREPYFEEVRSGARASGFGSNFSSWYELRAPAPKSGFEVDTHAIKYSLSGDRQCNAWSECQLKLSPDGEVTFLFRLQGHNEWFPPRPAYSEGVLRVRYIPTSR